VENDVAEMLSIVTDSKYDKSLVRILVVGCGNAPFSCDLYDDGYTNITNIDYSSTVIQNMQQLHTTIRPLMQWRVMDMTRMEDVPDDSFDVVIDKAAMDAIMTQEQDVWNPNPVVIQNVYRMCFHITRILSAAGTFVQISLSQPHFRNKYLLHIHPHPDSNDDDDDDDPIGMSLPDTIDSNNKHNNNNGMYCSHFGWSVQSEIAGRSDDISSGMFGHYLYIMKKGCQR
jgi:SAM-dependent methyltransferase